MKRYFVWCLLTYSAWAHAMSWNDLWFRPDQQGVRLLQQGKAEQAVTMFTDSQWQGTAYYRAGDYQRALQHFKQQSTADGYYNQGNALALQGDYQAALHAYQAALQQEPQHADAQYNYQIVKQLAQQQASHAASKAQQQEVKQPPQGDSQPANSKPQQAASEQPAQRPSSLASDPVKQADKNASQTPETLPHQGKSRTSLDKPPATSHITKDDAPPAPSNQPTDATPMTSSEDQHANEQWLRQIPDDPGGLLRQKFLRDYERMQH